MVACRSGLVIALSFWMVLLTHAQTLFFDDFSNPNLAERWQGQIANFRISNQELQLNALGAGTSTLATPFTFQDSITWELYFRMEFDPSGSNRLRIWLFSDQADVDAGNGYYLEIGESGNTDAIRLFRKSGSTRTQLANGSIGAVALANAEARIRVLCNQAGTWRLQADYSGGNLLVEEFEFLDPTFQAPQSEVFFGFQCAYTASRADLFFFDDVRIAIPEPDTDPPFISNFSVEDERSIFIRFNEGIDPNSAQSANFELIPAAGAIEVNTQIGSTAELLIQFSADFVNLRDYVLQVRGIQDNSGNVMRDTSLQFTWFLFEQASSYDIIFSEIMARPNPPLGLPNAEYFELYNRSDKVIDLQSLQILDGTTIRSFDSFVLLPGQFVIVCSRGNRSIFEPFGQVATMPSFPSLTIAGKRLILQDITGQLIDYVFYTEEWYNDRIKRNGGYALELINPQAPCSLSRNWTGSNSPLGGTPGMINSVWNPEEDLRAPSILNVYPTDASSVIVTFDKKMDRESAFQVSAFIIDPPLSIEMSTWTPLQPQQVQLIFGDDMESGVRYRLRAPGMQDCLGLSAFNDDSFPFGLPEDPEPLDLIINEVLFQAETGGSRFVEIKNRSNKIIDAFPLILADFSGNTPDGFRTEQQRLIFPGDIVAFTADPAFIRMRYQPPAEAIILNARVPTLSDREGNISVYTFVDNERVILDGLNYSRDFHYALLRDRRGVSIERIRPDAPTQDRNNWHSAAEQVGYATPGYENSQLRRAETESDSRVFFEDKFFSPDGDGFKDFLQINYQLERPGFVATVRIFDSEGRMVRHLVRGELLPAEGSFKWDGTNDTGGACRMGIYVVLAELVEPGGEVIRFKKDCVLGGQF